MNGHMALPDMVEENVGFALLTQEARVAWFRSTAEAMMATGCVYFRYTVNREIEPSRGLVEGWKHRQDPLRMAPVQWRTVDRKPTEGVVSATEDLSAVARPASQEIRA